MNITEMKKVLKDNLSTLKYAPVGENWADVARGYADEFESTPTDVFIKAVRYIRGTMLDFPQPAIIRNVIHTLSRERERIYYYNMTAVDLAAREVFFECWRWLNQHDLRQGLPIEQVRAVKAEYYTMVADGYLAIDGIDQETIHNCEIYRIWAEWFASGETDYENQSGIDYCKTDWSP